MLKERRALRLEWTSTVSQVTRMWLRFSRTGRILISGDVDTEEHSRWRKLLEAAEKWIFGSVQVNWFDWSKEFVPPKLERGERW